MRSGPRWCIDRRLPTAVAASGLADPVMVVRPLRLRLRRFGRVNRWEVVTRPATVASAAVRLGDRPQALAIGGFFTLLVLVVYVAIERSPAVWTQGLG